MLSTLYNLFFKKKLVVLSKNLPQSPVPNRILPKDLTPMTKMIVSNLSPYSRKLMLEDISNDDKEILDLENDPDYLEKMENNRLGFYMESFMSYYGLCPVCKQNTLRKYAQSNVPVVDFVCINKDYHIKSNTCFLFQLKISLNNQYFSFRQQTISIGSKKYGEIPHSIKGNGIKKIVPGYICLKLISKEMQTYKIDTQDSFIIIPNYLDNSNKSYYEYMPYLDKYGKNVITWNPTMFITPLVEDIIPLHINHEYFTETQIDNPYSEL